MAWGSNLFPLLIIVAGGRFTGLFVYSPSVGAGNLVDSIAAQPGTDPVGNPYVAGIASYNRAANQATALNGGALQFISNIALGTITGQYSQFPIPGVGTLVYMGALNGFLLGSSSHTSQTEAIIVPSGDTTGATDSTVLKDAFLTTNVVRLLPGTYYVTQGQVVVGLGQRLYGNGAMIMLAGAAAGPAVTLFSATGSSRFLTAEAHDLIIDGSGGANNSVGLQAGDISQIYLENVRVQNFGGGTGVGFSIVNQVNFTEQLHGQIYAVNCDQCLTFSVNGGSSGSFERLALDFWGEPNTGGFLVLMRNNATLLNGRLAIRGNMQGAGGAVLIMENTATIQQSFQLDIGVENDATSGAGPQTIDFISASNTIDAYGQMQFLQVAGGTAWTASNNNGNLNYQGTIYGDPALTVKVRNFEWTQITTGFPAGWSGTVAVRHSWNSGDVRILWELQIAATTVVTAGETVLAAAALGTDFRPTSAKNLPASEITGGGIAAGTFAGMQVTTGGGLIFQGAGFTPAGSASFLTGEAIYSNSI